MWVAGFSLPEFAGFSTGIPLKFTIVLDTFAVNLADIHWFTFSYVFAIALNRGKISDLVHLLLPKLASPIAPRSGFEKNNRRLLLHTQKQRWDRQNYQSLTHFVKVLPAIKHLPPPPHVVLYNFVASEDFWISHSAVQSRTIDPGRLCLSNKGHSLYGAYYVLGWFCQPKVWYVKEVKERFVVSFFCPFSIVYSMQLSFHSLYLTIFKTCLYGSCRNISAPSKTFKKIKTYLHIWNINW